MVNAHCGQEFEILALADRPPRGLLLHRLMYDGGLAWNGRRLSRIEGIRIEVCHRSGKKMLNGRKRTTVDRTGSVLSQESQMLWSTVPLMFGKIVLRVPAVILDHQSIARNLGNNRRRGNRT